MARTPTLAGCLPLLVFPLFKQRLLARLRSQVGTRKRWACTVSMDRSDSAVRAAMGLIRETPGTEDCLDPLCVCNGFGFEHVST